MLVNASTAKRPIRSSFTRLALLVAFTAILCVSVLFSVTHYVVTVQSRQTLLQAIDGDLAGLVDIYATSGEGELLARLSDRMALLPVQGNEVHYFLANASGQRIAGNLGSWPLLSAENSEVGLIKGLPRAPSLARATQLAPDLKLVVGRSLANVKRLQDRLVTAFCLAGLCVIAVAVGLGLLFARRTQARILAMNATFRSVSSGTLQRRTPTSGQGDEIDELTRHTNDMLDRVAALISAHRNVTDHTAHEIRTPLMHLDTRILQVLKKSDTPEFTQDLSQARQHIKRIVMMLDSLLDIAANQAHRGSLIGLEQLNFSDVARQVADLFADSAEDMGIAFFVDVEDGIYLNGDRMQLSRLISNLLDNAFKYCGENGQVALRLKQGPTLSVHDSGPGVPEDARASIFNRFERAANPNADVSQPDNERAGGHGLGLSLARAIAERHGLSLTCEPSSSGALFLLKRA